MMGFTAKSLVLSLLLGLLPSAAQTAMMTESEHIAELYKENCAVCHGDQGDGQTRARYGLNPPPRDFTSPSAWQELTAERMRTSISQGRPGTGMVAWDKRLTTQQIDGLVGYIRSNFMRKPESDSAAQGAALYKKHCSACHGDKGSGAQWTQYSLNPPPRDFTAPESRAELSLDRMMASVTHGRPGTAMMSFAGRLEAQQIAAVVDYIRSTFMQAGATPMTSAPMASTPAASARPAHPAAPTPAPTPEPVIAADMTLAFPHGLVGDVQRGREFYMNNCFTCHGEQGAGNGPRSNFIKPRPRNFLAVESRQRLNRTALFQAIARGKQGTVMPAWATVLDNQQIADVAEFVFQEFIRSDEQAKKKAPAWRAR